VENYIIEISYIKRKTLKFFKNFRVMSGGRRVAESWIT